MLEKAHPFGLLNLLFLSAVFPLLLPLVLNDLMGRECGREE